MPFTFLDVIIVAVFLLGIFAGVGQGMVRQIFSLLGLVVGVVIASQRYQDAAGYLSWLNNPDGAKILSFALITLIILVVATAFGAAVHRALRYMALGCVDWLGGGVIGAFETLFFVDIALILAMKYPVLGLPQAIQESTIPTVVLKLAPTMLSFLPPEFEAVRKALQ